MKKQIGGMDIEMVIAAIAFALVVLLVISVSVKQDNDHKKFMGECLQYKKQYECDVLWSQTDASKQTRDLAIGIAAGAAIGAAAGRR